MQIFRIDIAIPHVPPQTIDITEFASKRFVCKIKDRWERSIAYQGIELGFGIRLFKTTYDTSSILFLDWTQAIYTDGRGKASSIDIYYHTR